jgi:hypothetical protein
MWDTDKPLPRLSTLPKDVQDRLRYIRAEPEEPPDDESENYIVCPACGQAVDGRSLYQVMHHAERGHAPLTDAELTQLAGAALMQV